MAYQDLAGFCPTIYQAEIIGKNDDEVLLSRK
jgi:hypothetical protein